MIIQQVSSPPPRDDYHGGAGKCCTAVSPVVDGRHRSTECVGVHRLIRHAGLGSRGRVLKRAGLGIGCRMVALPRRRLDRVTGVIIDRLGLFQDDIVCDCQCFSVGRFIKVVTFVSDDWTTEAVERGLSEFLRPRWQ